jgi:hypothetical protein
MRLIVLLTNLLDYFLIFKAFCIFFYIIITNSLPLLKAFIMPVLNNKLYLEQKALDELREEEDRLFQEIIHWEKDDMFLQLPKSQKEKSENKASQKKEGRKTEETKIKIKKEKSINKLPSITKSTNSIDMNKLKREPLVHSINNLKFERMRKPSIRDMGDLGEKQSKKKGLFFFSPRNQIQTIHPNSTFMERNLQKEYFINKFEELSRKFGVKVSSNNEQSSFKREERKTMAINKIAFQSIRFPNDILKELERRFQ